MSLNCDYIQTRSYRTRRMSTIKTKAKTKIHTQRQNDNDDLQ